MFKWLKSLFTKEDKRKADFFDIPLQNKPKRPRLYKQATVVTKGELPIKRKPATKKPVTKKTTVKPKAKAKK